MTKPIDLSTLRIAALLNRSSGSCDAACEDRMAAILTAADAQPIALRTVEGHQVEAALNELLSDKPDVLIVLGGDGTIRTAAELCAESGTKLIPLPGGTMNMLPKALYGEGTWVEVLERTLAAPSTLPVAGGEVEGHRFFCAGLFGSPALWAEAREAVRKNRWRDAVRGALRAYHRAFSGKIRYRSGDSGEQSATALAAICPLISSALHAENKSLELAAFTPGNLADAAHLGWTAFFSDWRQDRNVSVLNSDTIRIRAGARIPALLDGEKVTLGRAAEIRFVQGCFTAVVPQR